MRDYSLYTCFFVYQFLSVNDIIFIEFLNAAFSIWVGLEAVGKYVNS